MAVTPNMGLVKWNLLSDPYDHSQLAGNFDAIDAHDHTEDKGRQIPTEGIEDLAIVTMKIADASVTTAKLADKAVTSTKIADGVTASLGDFKWWWRPSLLLSVPTGGWVIAQGQSLTSSQHDFPGGGTITLPNLMDKFIRGVTSDNIGSLGGSATINLNHSHNVNGHTHTIQPHSHFLNLQSGFGAATNLKISQDLAGSSWVHADDANNQEHRHSINGSADSTGLTTDSASSSTDGRLSSSQSIIPPWIGFLPLIKVKNS